MAGSEPPRDKFKRDVLDALAASGFPPSQLDVVARALDDKTTDALFAKATTSATVTALPNSVAIRVTEWYHGDAANAFAQRESQHSNVRIEGSVYGPVTGRDIVANQVTQTGGIARDVIVGWADQVLRDLETHGTDVTEGNKLRDDLRDVPMEHLPERLARFVAWAKSNAVELSGLGLSFISVMTNYLETLRRWSTLERRVGCSLHTLAPRLRGPSQSLKAYAACTPPMYAPYWCDAQSPTWN